MKRIIIIGATSGIGMKVTKQYIRKGYRIGIAGRRTQLLEDLKAIAPSMIETESIDVTHEEAEKKLLNLIHKLGGMDLFLLSSGIGNQNPQLDPSIEIQTARTNTEGFTRMVTAAFRYFRTQREGHIAVISSIAGTKGLGIAPAYSATKRFQNTYIEALAQLAYMEHLSIRFTDIRPGFVATPLLHNGQYPLLMKADYVAAKLIRAIEKKKRIAVIDRRYAFIVFLWRMIPRCLWEHLSIRQTASQEEL